MIYVNTLGTGVSGSTSVSGRALDPRRSTENRPYHSHLATEPADARAALRDRCGDLADQHRRAARLSLGPDRPGQRLEISDRRQDRAGQGLRTSGRGGWRSSRQPCGCEPRPPSLWRNENGPDRRPTGFVPVTAAHSERPMSCRPGLEAFGETW